MYLTISLGSLPYEFIVCNYLNMKCMYANRKKTTLIGLLIISQR